MADQGSQGLLSPLLRRVRIGAATPFLRGRVLDIGCGTGGLATLVPPDRYTGFDKDAASINEARKRLPQYSFFTELPEGQTFDTIVALAVIEHLEQPLSELVNWGDLLAPEGIIVLTTPHKAFRMFHEFGAALGIFSADAADEHEEMFDKASLVKLIADAQLHPREYRRFLVGGNQLVVAGRERTAHPIEAQ
jgi:2-polyprenyl-3-methyl-5-hydroxy-6-metoxy-1,4-benzoquinol methylase